MSGNAVKDGPVKVAIVGVGGFGGVYVKAILENMLPEGLAEFCAAVDPYAEKSSWYGKICESGVPVFPDMDAMFEKTSPELVVIATPIQFHHDQAVSAMRHGCGVLIEKPFAGSSELCRDMMRVRDETGAYLSVGFQWCDDAAMRKAKEDRDSGMFGGPVSGKAIVLWPRNRAYYSRGIGWAGRKFSKDGQPIFDSVASNATAHYLFNMLWFLGDGLNAAEPVSVTATERRANDIETFDTIVMRARLDNGSRILYVASHAAGAAFNRNPCFEYTFEKGRLRYGNPDQKERELEFVFNDGTVKSYGISNRDDNTAKFMHALQNVRLGSAGTAWCRPEAALMHILAMERAYASAGEAEVFPADKVDVIDDTLTVRGLGEELNAEYERG